MNDYVEGSLVLVREKKKSSKYSQHQLEQIYLVSLPVGADLQPVSSLIRIGDAHFRFAA